MNNKKIRESLIVAGVCLLTLYGFFVANNYEQTKIIHSETLAPKVISVSPAKVYILPDDNIHLGTAEDPNQSKAPTTASNDASLPANATQDWTTVTNIYTTGSSYATMSGAGHMPIITNYSFYADCTGLGFTIPQGDVINGVVFSIDGEIGGASSGSDNSVELIVSGSPAGSDLHTGTAWTTSIVNYSYGSSTNLWGNTLTPTIVDASNFGVAFSAKFGVLSGSKNLFANTANMTVYYTIPPNMWFLLLGRQ